VGPRVVDAVDKRRLLLPGVERPFPVKGNNQHSAQTDTYPFASLHLHVSVSVDHLQSACSFTILT
jgi:hypothetical protein